MLGGGVQFQSEDLSKALLEEAKPLLEAHWQEISHYPDIPLSVDEFFYLQSASMKMTRVFTARSEGKLVGYCVYFVKANPHYQESLQANQDVLFLTKELRGGMQGYKFIQFCDEQLKQLGVQVVYQHVKHKHNFGPMLERMGYELIDHIYGRRLN
jgi:hypothetical protein